MSDLFYLNGPDGIDYIVCPKCYKKRFRAEGVTFHRSALQGTLQECCDCPEYGHIMTKEAMHSLAQIVSLEEQLDIMSKKVEEYELKAEEITRVCPLLTIVKVIRSPESGADSLCLREKCGMYNLCLPDGVRQDIVIEIGKEEQISIDEAAEQDKKSLEN